MNIGIDIDGVLTDYQRSIIDYGTKMCIDEKWPIDIDVTKYLELDTFNWNEEQSEKYWNRYMVEKYLIESPVRTFAPEVIKKLKQEGNKIYLITARTDEELPKEHRGKMKQITKKWLKSKKIKYDKLMFETEKLQPCLENYIDVIIEDCPENIRNLSSQIKVIKFDCQYNKDVNNENVTTAYSWYDIYRIINQMRGE